MDVLSNLAMGFVTIFTQPISLVYCLIGVIAGVLIGALPGLGPAMGIAILLPLTYGTEPVFGLILLTGIYYGAMYGGAITSILINTPGEAAAVMTALDGYPMAVNGQAEKALGMAGIASVIGGTICVVAFMFCAPLLAEYAVKFGPAEYFALMVLGMSSISGMTGKHPGKSFLAAAIGLFIATIGIDPQIGSQRFTFGNPNLLDGINFVPVAMGLFGIAEIIGIPEETNSELVNRKFSMKKLFPTKTEWKLCMPHIASGSIIGFLIGALPGAGATIASFISYDFAKRIAPPERKKLFGTGIIEGVAAPESANNAASVGALVPMLTLGIPGSNATAVMMGALMMHKIVPGPTIFAREGEMVWGLVASMYVGNVILFIVSISALTLFVQILKVKPGVLNAIVLGFIFVGAYAYSNSLFVVGLATFFGVLGFIMKKFELPAAPMVLALVLGSLTESNLRQALLLADGNFLKVISTPISSVVLVLAFLIAFGNPMLTAVKRRSAKRAARQK